MSRITALPNYPTFLQLSRDVDGTHALLVISIIATLFPPDSKLPKNRKDHVYLIDGFIPNS